MKSRMREIFKYGSVRGVMSSHVYKLNTYKEASMPTRRAPSEAKAIKLDNPAQAKRNQQLGTELHILGGNE